MAVLVLVPCLIFMQGGAVQTNLRTWAPEPVEICMVVRHPRPVGLWFNCRTPDGRFIKFSLTGVHRA